MGQKFLSFRFDIDSHVCLKKGVPNLIRLGKETGAKFTFFVHMGRAIHRSLILRNILSNNVGFKKNTKIPLLKILGLKDYLITAILNPNIGLNNIGEIKDLIKEGHEFGLHGGKNHALWQKTISSWSAERIRKELSDVLAIIKDNKLPMPMGFASPGFQGTRILNEELAKLGFHYVSDTFREAIDDNREGVVKKYKNDPLPNIHVNITSGSSVAYIESLRARGYNQEMIIANFEENLRKIKKYAVVYGHPNYSGVKELDTVRLMVKSANKLGFKIVTLDKLYKHIATFS
jgi:peptidoglycan/xylan/chitin deacetylase (PgdA/CDA1 family)